MDQMELFGSGELVTIKEYLTGWNEATRARVLSKKEAEREQRIRRLSACTSCADKPSPRQAEGTRK